MTDTLGPYELQRLIGRGGMGEVHLAMDTKLGRTVALKLLPPDLAADEERRGRFLREARAAAALSHPNITTIHDVGEADGRDYIAQEFVDGRPLSEIVTERRLPVAELADLAVPLADALSYAHEQGVIHRDLKAANILVDGRGHPKLLDFGLAKVLHEGEATAGQQSTTLTIQGAIFGTPSAMSPEQALGKTVDARSDVFSFGSLLYEMATGKPAFLGTTVQETLDKVVHDEPEPLERLRRDLPSDFTSIVAKALRKTPAERYQRMDELAADLKHFKRQTDSGLVPPVAQRPATGRRRALAGLLVVAVAVLAVVVWWQGSGSTAPDAPAGTAAGTSDAGDYVAVMYVENIIDPADTEHLGAMLAHLLTTELASSSDLRTLSQQRLYETARQLGREDGSIDRSVASSVAETAGVGTMLLGQITRLGGRLLATVTLVDAATGADLGAARAEGKGEDDLFSMAESLGGQVRVALGRQVGADAEGSLQNQITSSVEAYRAFVRGMKQVHEQKFFSASKSLEEAVSLDPAFALARFWHAISLGWAPGTSGDALREIEAAAAMPERLPDEVAGLAQAAVHYVRGDYPTAHDMLSAYLDEEPDNKLAVYMLAEIHLHSPLHADPGEAGRLFRRTLELDPGFTMVRDHLAACYVYDNRPEEILALIEAWELDEVERLHLRATAAQRMGDPDLARSLLESREDESLQDRLDGLLETTEEEVADLREQLPDMDPERRAVVETHTLARRLIELGEFDEALRLLPSMPAPGPGLYDWEQNQWSGARLDEAFLHELRGDMARARASAERTLELQPLAPRNLYVSAMMAARGGDVGAARAHVEALADVAASQTAVTAPVYLDAARAELALAESDTDQAVAFGTRAVATDLFLADWWSNNRSFGPVVRWGLARALRAAGDADGERAALEALVAARREGGSHLHRTRALGRLGVLQWQAGHREAAEEHLAEFLDAWGEADWELQEIEEARRLLTGE